MSNTYFQFKEFIVHQDHCAMKVCTDACLFGAWLANKWQGKTFTKMLDIGTGTGLLSLMIAQQNSSPIDAVEIDIFAAHQAKQNIAASPWNQQIKVIVSDIQQYFTAQYDCIFSNPPFYENNLKSSHTSKNVAHHSTELTLEQLFATCQTISTANGILALLLPFHRWENAKVLGMKYNWFLNEMVQVHQTTQHTPFRSMMLFYKQPQNVSIGQIHIKNGQDYTPEFAQLLKKYYLYNP